MALVCFNSLTLSSSYSPTLANTSTSVSRCHVKPIDLPQRTSSGIRISTAFSVKKVSAVTVRAASDADADAEASAADDGSNPERKEEVVAVDKLPLGIEVAGEARAEVEDEIGEEDKASKEKAGPKAATQEER